MYHKLTVYVKSRYQTNLFPSCCFGDKYHKYHGNSINRLQIRPGAIPPSMIPTPIPIPAHLFDSDSDSDSSHLGYDSDSDSDSNTIFMNDSDSDSDSDSIPTPALPIF